MPNLLDTYSLYARLAPVLLALFPIFLTVAVWAPQAYQLAVGLVALMVTCGLTLAIAHYARRRGRLLQNKLVDEWGGMPTTLWLRRSDENLDPLTKRRYHDFLENNIPSWSAPTEEEESADQAMADQRYDSAVKWLLEYARDTKAFPLVFSENKSYGFRRNALAMKWLGVWAALAAAIYAVYRFYSMSIDQIEADHLLQLLASGLVVLLFFFWCFVVDKSWVRDAADAYAKQLLASCDTGRG